MKLAIVVGHNAGAQGAVRVTDGRTEFDWNGDLAALIHDIDPNSVRVFYRKSSGGYRAEIRRVYAEVDDYGADLSMELHFNGASPAARGCETLSSGTEQSLRLANIVQRQIIEVLPVADRGVKIRGRDGRGGFSLWAGRTPAVLLEPYFGSNTDDCHLADDYKSVLAQAIYDAAVEFVGADRTVQVKGDFKVTDDMIADAGAGAVLERGFPWR